MVAPKRDNQETCIVVPLSTVEPKRMRGFHHKLECMSLPTGLRDRQSWVKANVVITVALWRLDRVANGRDANGKRIFACHRVTSKDWHAIQQAVAAALGWERRFVL